MKGTLLDTTVLIDLSQGNTATAMIQDLDLVTDNERHFRMIPELRVERPY
jgi:predicted nucleic acid-binding protein